MMHHAAGSNTLTQPTTDPLSSSTLAAAMKDAKNGADRKRDESVLYSHKTKGLGDCGFHAILGEWNGQHYECKDIALEREKISKAINECKTDDAIHKLVVAGVEALVMGGDRGTGDHIERLRVAYQKHRDQQGDALNVRWAIVESCLNQYPAIVKHINDNVLAEEKRNSHPNGKRKLDTLQEKFNFCLNIQENKAGEVLDALMQSDKALNNALEHYNSADKQNANIHALIDATIIQDYAKFMGKSHQWLLPHELELIARVNHITVALYSPDIKKGPFTLLNTYHPGAPRHVEVRFNGRDHYERVTRDANPHQLNQPSAKVDKDNKAIPKGVANILFALAIDFKDLENQTTLLEDDKLQEHARAFIAVIENKINKIKKVISTTGDYQKIVFTIIENIETTIRGLNAFKIDLQEDKAVIQTIIAKIQTPCKELRAQIGNQWLAKDDMSADELQWKIFALPCQQQLLTNDTKRKQDFETGLQNTRRLIQQRKGTAAASLFISYAWPTPQHLVNEYWLQPFLKQLREHLRLAGLHAILDIVDNKPGGNIVQFMEQAKDSEFVLLLCTESLQDKHLSGHGLKAVATELNNINRKRKMDIERGLTRVFPFLMTGTHATSYPSNYGVQCPNPT